MQNALNEHGYLQLCTRHNRNELKAAGLNLFCDPFIVYLQSHRYHQPQPKTQTSAMERINSRQLHSSTRVDVKSTEYSLNVIFFPSPPTSISFGAICFSLSQIPLQYSPTCTYLSIHITIGCQSFLSYIFVITFCV